MKMKKLLILIIGLALANIIFADGGKIESVSDAYKSTIRGRVMDNETEMPLVGATVVILESTPQIGTITDMDGEFKFEGVEIGRHEMQISFIGYKFGRFYNGFI